MRYICSICGYVYEEAENTPWAELPEDWKCPLCGAAKSNFAPEGGTQPAAKAGIAAEAKSQPAAEVKLPSYAETEMKPLTAVETGALCSNLAKGCEKQYLNDQAAAFRKLAEWFESQDEGKADPSFEKILDLINADLGDNYPAANAASQQDGDRGALRSLTWSEKVTLILKSLLDRYAREGDAMLKNTGIYVCTICGFIYVGNDLPEVCPVCKVPNRKFEQIGG